MLKTIALTLSFAAIASASADATTGPAMLGSASPIGLGSNMANSAQSEGPILPGFTVSIGGATIACSTVSASVTAVTTTTLTATPSFSGCASTVAGVGGSAEVTAPCDWRLSVSAAPFNSNNGATTGGTFTTNCTTRITFAVFGVGCTMNFFAQTREGIALQNVNTFGANSVSATPWGVTITAPVTGLTYTWTQPCSVPEHGNFDWWFSIYVKNLWGKL